MIRDLLFVLNKAEKLLSQLEGTKHKELMILLQSEPTTHNILELVRFIHASEII